MGMEMGHLKRMAHLVGRIDDGYSLCSPFVADGNPQILSAIFGVYIF